MLFTSCKFLVGSIRFLLTKREFGFLNYTHGLGASRDEVEVAENGATKNGQRCQGSEIFSNRCRNFCPPALDECSNRVTIL